VRRLKNLDLGVLMASFVPPAVHFRVNRDERT
jgi:hypothetical protein